MAMRHDCDLNFKIYCAVDERRIACLIVACWLVTKRIPDAFAEACLFSVNTVPSYFISLRYFTYSSSVIAYFRWIISIEQKEFTYAPC